MATPDAAAAPAKSGSLLLAAAPALIVLQILSRLVTSVLNQVLVRVTSPAIFGAASIQLELLLSTILFVSREGVRSAILRSQVGEEGLSVKKDADEDGGGGGGGGDDVLSDRERAVHNVSLLPVAAGAVISVLASATYLQRADLALRAQPNFTASVVLYSLGALLELAAEPLYTRAQTQLRVQLRVRAEGLAVLSKCIVTLAAVIVPRYLGAGAKDSVIETGLIAFGLGQAAYGLTTLVVYVVAFQRSDGIRGLRSLLSLKKAMATPNTSIAARDALAPKYFDPSTLALAWAMVKQSLLKHLLTEGDKFAVARLAPLDVQGGYALASNYGSLVARMLFQPIEESSRLVFSRSFGSSEATAQDSRTVHRPQAAFDSAADLLSALLRFHLLLALFFTALGPPLCHTFLYLVAGQRWAATAAPRILSAFAWYVPVMGVNGITEAFLQATADRAALASYSSVMVSASGLFIASLWALTHLGDTDTALVWANIVTLGVRAAYSWRFVMRFFRASGGPAADRVTPAAARPSVPVVLTFAGAATVLRWSEGHSAAHSARSLRDLVPHVGVGILCLLVCIVSCAIFERQPILQAVQSIRGARDEKQRKTQ